jgi:hypothetical protein
MSWPAPTVARIALDELPGEGTVTVTRDGMISWDD